MNLPNLNPYAVVAKVAGIALVTIAIVALAMSWLARGQAIAEHESYEQTVIQVTTLATVVPDAKGRRKPLDRSAVPAAIAGLKSTADSCLAASSARDLLAQQAKLRADNADKALANAQVLMRGEYGSAAKRIAALEQVKAQPTPQLQCQQIATDSRAAWEGWK